MKGETATGHGEYSETPVSQSVKGLSPSPSLRKYSMDYEVKAKVFIKTLNSPAQPFFCLFCLFNFLK